MNESGLPVRVFSSDAKDRLLPMCAENELSWDSSDWESAWDGGVSRDEDGGPASVVGPFMSVSLFCA